MSRIQEELEKVVGVGQWKFKEEQEYLAALVEEIVGCEDEEGNPTGGVSDEVWFALSEEARAWLEKGIEALSSGGKLPDFPDKGAEEEKGRPARKREKPLEKTPIKGEPESLDIADLKEREFYAVTIEKEGSQRSYEGIVDEITKRSLVILVKGGEEVVVHKRDIISIFPLMVREEKEEILGKKGKTLLVKDAVKGELYRVPDEDGEMAEAECVRVTSWKGVFEDEEGDRIRLDLDVEIEHIVGVVAEEKGERGESEKPIEKGSPQKERVEEKKKKKVGYPRYQSVADVLKKGKPGTLQELAEEADKLYVKRSGKKENLKESLFWIKFSLQLLGALGVVKEEKGEISLLLEK